MGLSGCFVIALTLGVVNAISVPTSPSQQAKAPHGAYCGTSDKSPITVQALFHDGGKEVTLTGRILGIVAKECKKEEMSFDQESQILTLENTDGDSCVGSQFGMHNLMHPLSAEKHATDLDIVYDDVHDKITITAPKHWSTEDKPTRMKLESCPMSMLQSLKPGKVALVKADEDVADFLKGRPSRMSLAEQERPRKRSDKRGKNRIKVKRDSKRGNPEEGVVPQDAKTTKRASMADQEAWDRAGEDRMKIKDDEMRQRRSPNEAIEEFGTPEEHQRTTEEHRRHRGKKGSSLMATEQEEHEITQAEIEREEMKVKRAETKAKKAQTVSEKAAHDAAKIRNVVNQESKQLETVHNANVAQQHALLQFDEDAKEPQPVLDAKELHGLEKIKHQLAQSKLLNEQITEEMQVKSEEEMTPVEKAQRKIQHDHKKAAAAATKKAKEAQEAMVAATKKAKDHIEELARSKKFKLTSKEGADAMLDRHKTEARLHAEAQAEMKEAEHQVRKAANKAHAEASVAAQRVEMAKEKADAKKAAWAAQQADPKFQEAKEAKFRVIMEAQQEKIAAGINDDVPARKAKRAALLKSMHGATAKGPHVPHPFKKAQKKAKQAADSVRDVVTGATKRATHHATHAKRHKKKTGFTEQSAHKQAYDQARAKRSQNLDSARAKLNKLSY